ncbi:hypothetical protein LJR231_002243 [Phyllobacterium sp. LjRoot231]|uniref:hypothetical protein n=1 Tax=Phyllobacterium sp. LjRoot231 TaxID=3342289 RepID=UPI003ED149BB
MNELFERTPKDLALSAASQAADATAELVRFAIEGEALNGFFETDLVEQLLDAAKITMELSQEHLRDEGKSEVYGAIAKFLEAYA